MTIDTIALPATRFITFLATDENRRFVISCRPAVNQPLRKVRIVAANDADRTDFHNFICQRHQGGNDAKGLPSKIEIQPCYDDPATLIDKLLEYRDCFGREKLNFIDPYNVNRIVDHFNQ